MNNRRLTDHEQLRTLEPMRIILLPDVAKFLGVSVETLQRHHGDKIIRISPRRRGMRVRDVLAIGPEKGDGVE